MSTQRIGPLAQAWYKWKALRLPWRKRFLVGFDLNGNTYWEFRLTNSDSERLRRIVKYPRSTHLSSVKVTPQWHQWLRYTRDDPPSMEEQRDDVTRQVRMKQLAAAADARWEAKPRLVEDPSGAHALPHAAPKQTDSAAGNGSAHRTAESTEETDDAKISNESRPDPWAQHRSHGPGEKWQPSAWNPSAPKSKTSKP